MVAAAIWHICAYYSAMYLLSSRRQQQGVPRNIIIDIIPAGTKEWRAAARIIGGINERDESAAGRPRLSQTILTDCYYFIRRASR